MSCSSPSPTMHVQLLCGSLVTTAAAERGQSSYEAPPLSSERRPQPADPRHTHTVSNRHTQPAHPWHTHTSQCATRVCWSYVNVFIFQKLKVTFLRKIKVFLHFKSVFKSINFSTPYSQGFSVVMMNNKIKSTSAQGPIKEPFYLIYTANMILCLLPSCFSASTVYVHFKDCCRVWHRAAFLVC